MYKTYFHYYVSLLQVFQHFQFLFFQEKGVNHSDFQKIEHRLQENILHHFHLHSFI